MIPRNVIPTQQEADLNNPEEHFLWALRNLPMVAGSGMMTFSPFLRGWSSHLWECGFAHRDYLERLADEDGNIHVSQLPQQVKKFQPPFRGPHHTYNPAARWVKSDTPEPKPFTVPNIKQMTLQEKYALAYQLKQEGVTIPDAPKPMKARVV
jgi:hypothetical protein